VLAAASTLQDGEPRVLPANKASSHDATCSADDDDVTPLPAPAAIETGQVPCQPPTCQGQPPPAQLGKGDEGAVKAGWMHQALVAIWVGVTLAWTAELDSPFDGGVASHTASGTSQKGG
jgi:hypothetical protein